MIRKEYLKYVTPILLFFLMLIDAHLTKSFETWTSNVYFASSHLLLLAFMFAVPNFSKRYLLITSLILGFICDSYYIGIIGIYTVALTISVMLMYTFKEVIQTNLLTGFFGIVIYYTCVRPYIAIEHGVVCYFILSTEKTVFRKIKIENFVRLRKMLIC